MPTRRDTCGECGASKVVPDGDWNTVQRPLIEAWEQQHELDAHEGEHVAWQLEPNPMLEP
jgi:hypothetical protein